MELSPQPFFVSLRVFFFLRCTYLCVCVSLCECTCTYVCRADATGGLGVSASVAVLCFYPEAGLSLSWVRLHSPPVCLPWSWDCRTGHGDGFVTGHQDLNSGPRDCTEVLFPASHLPCPIVWRQSDLKLTVWPRLVSDSQ